MTLFALLCKSYITQATNSPNKPDYLDWSSLLSKPDHILFPISRHEHEQDTHFDTHSQSPTQFISQEQTTSKEEDRKRKKAAYFREYRKRPEVKAKMKEKKNTAIMRERLREDYHRRKEKRGYGRIQSTLYSQLANRVLSNQANEEEVLLYKEMKAKKSQYNNTYNAKRKTKKNKKVGR